MEPSIDYLMAGYRRRRAKARSNRIPIDQAREAYDRLGSWRRVADEVRRPDGTKFTPNALFAAVRYADRGFAGRLIGGR